MFRFTTRDLLWLMVVVGLVIVWRIDRRELAKAREEATDLKGTVSRWFEYGTGLEHEIRSLQQRLRESAAKEI